MLIIFVKEKDDRTEKFYSYLHLCIPGIYGRLNQEAVRSAEALHLMERNFQEELKSKSQRGEEEIEDVTMLASAHAPSKVSEVSLSDSAGTGGGKRKKLLTRQEREARQLTRHRKRWFVSSSSDEEQVEEIEMGEGQNTISPVTSSHKVHFEKLIFVYVCEIFLECFLYHSFRDIVEAE